MSYQEKDIAFEKGDYWVLRVPYGKKKGTYEVYKVGVTHSTRCGIIGFRDDEGLARAKAEVERRIIADANPK